MTTGDAVFLVVAVFLYAGALFGLGVLVMACALHLNQPGLMLVCVEAKDLGVHTM